MSTRACLQIGHKRSFQTGHGDGGSRCPDGHGPRHRQETHLIVESGEVCVPSKNNPALIWSLSDQDLKHL